MVGACDCNGILQYSWNLMSNGEVFSSGSKPIVKESLKIKLEKNKPITIDIYDYDSLPLKKFIDSFKTAFNIEDNQIIKVSSPSAIWAGYQLYNQTLEYLLWLPSNKGKKNYPSYDLIFLGALLDKGYNIIIGKKGNSNSIVAIGPTIEDAKKIYETGLSLIPINERFNIKKIVNKLQIIN